MPDDDAMIGIVDLKRAEADLAAGELACPGCDGRLRRWGHPRARDVRDQGATTLRLRPRRARCGSCGATHVLLLTAVLPRRADTTAVIGAALLASARGTGYRRIAGGIRRPTTTVRRWVRAVRDADHIQWLRAQGVEWIAQVDREVLATLAPEPTRLGEALAAAAVVVGARLALYVPALDVDRSVHRWTARRPGRHRRICATLRVLARPQPAATAPTSVARDARFTSASQ